MIIDLKSELRNQKLTVGSWITMGDTCVPEIMARAGFDWLAVDMEHSAITLYEAQRLVQVIELSGIAPLIRVGENNPNTIKRAMDTGAHGVIVPMINNRENAASAVEAVKYPPKGKRGVGLARAQGYGLDFKRYREWVNKNSIVIVQIEHIDGIRDLEEILKVNGVDGSIIGPYDLSGSLGYPGEFERPEVKKALILYEDICKKLKKPMGFHIVHPDSKIALYYKKRGYTFLAIGLDTLYLGEKCDEVMKDFKG